MLHITPCLVTAVHILAGLAILVLFIMCAVKSQGYKNQIPA